MKSIILAFVLGLVLLAGCTAPPAQESVSPEEETPLMEDSAPPAEHETPVEETPPSAEEESPPMEEPPPSEPASDSYIDVSPEEASALIESTPDLVIIDVSPHYANGHLPGAVSYYLGDGSLDAAIPTLDMDRPYLVYCHVDSVAITGAQKLVDAGFSPVYRLEGNYGAWVAAGYPIEK